VKKVKIRVVSSEEDKKLKKQLNQKSDLAFKPEVFLGELLKKTEKDEKTRQVVEAKAEVKQETLDTKTAQLLEKEDIVEKIEHEIEEEIEKETIRIIEPQIKNINLRNDQVSQETIQKIEDELIGQIIDDPKNIEAYKRLGKIYYNQDKFEYARESFEMAIKLGSGDQKIKDLLRDCEEKIGK
jgi:tetratricopeptide (TPR) repeat protein